MWHDPSTDVYASLRTRVWSHSGKKTTKENTQQLLLSVIGHYEVIHSTFAIGKKRGTCIVWPGMLE